MKIYFFSLVYEGMPWVRGQKEFSERLRDLEFCWHWAEGLARHEADTAWCAEQGGSLPSSPISTDGTREFLRQWAGEDGRIFLHDEPSGGLWPGKTAMVRAATAGAKEGDLLWQVDADEFWQPWQVAEIVGYFRDHPETSAGWFDCHYFFGWDRVSSRPGVFGNFRSREWLRIWRFRSGDHWRSHEPPVLERKNGKKVIDVGFWKPLCQRETRRRGWIFQHYALADERQIRFKERYYGYRGLVTGMERLARDPSPCPKVRNYLPHVRQAELGTARTFRNFFRRGLEPLWPAARAESPVRAGIFPVAMPGPAGKVTFRFQSAAAPWHSVLLIRGDRLGEAVLFTSFLRSFVREFPECRITLAVPENTQEVYDLSKLPLQLETFESGRISERAVLHDLLQRLQRSRFDLAAVPSFNRNKEMLWLLRHCRARKKVAFQGEMRGVRKRHRWWHELWIREKLGVEEESLGLARPDLHELEKYRRLLIHLGASGDIEPPVLSATHLPSPQSKAGKRKLGVAPGLEGSIKEYPHWDKVASLMDAGEPCSWAVLGLAGDPISPSFDSGNRECRDLRGKTNLESLVREVRGLDLLLASDTGTAHLACALGTPVLVVLGGGDYGRFFPNHAAVVLTRPLACFQCHWECIQAEPVCIRGITPEEVAQVAQGILAGRIPAGSVVMARGSRPHPWDIGVSGFLYRPGVPEILDAGTV